MSEEVFRRSSVVEEECQIKSVGEIVQEKECRRKSAREKMLDKKCGRKCVLERVMYLLNLF